MTVSTTSNKKTWDGNGSATSFSFSFKVTDESTLDVYHIDSSGTKTPLTLDVDYTVSLNSDQDANPGGSISYPVSGSALPSGEQLFAIRVIDLLQDDDLKNQGGFFADVHENLFDELTMLAQQLDEVQDRSLVQPIEETGANLTLPLLADRKGKFLYFDDSTGELKAASAATSAPTVTSWAETLLDDASASEALDTLGFTAFAKTLIDDADAATARATLGVTRSNLSAQVSGLSAYSGVLCPHKNLTVKPNSGAPNSQIDIDADALLLTDANGDGALVSSVNLTADLTASGANGLDTGTAANDTWYHVWVIYNPASDTVASLLSTASSLSSLTLPSGYTFAGYVGAAFSILASSDLLQFTQNNSSVAAEPKQVLSGGSSPVSSPMATVDLSSNVPDTCRKVSGYGEITNTGGTSDVATGVVASVSQGEYGAVHLARGDMPAGEYLRTPVEVALVDTQAIYYRVAGNNSELDLHVTGWEF